MNSILLDESQHLDEVEQHLENNNNNNNNNNHNDEETSDSVSLTDLMDSIMANEPEGTTESEVEENIPSEQAPTAQDAVFTIVYGEYVTVRNQQAFERIYQQVGELTNDLDNIDAESVLYSILSDSDREDIIRNRIVSFTQREIEEYSHTLTLVIEHFRNQHGYWWVYYQNGRFENVHESLEIQTQEPNPEPVTPEPVEITQEPTPAPRRQTRRGNDYTLAWEIYSLGYSSGEVANIYNTSAGSISRGMKKDGREMRTGAQTREMRKVNVEEFESEFIGRITDLLEEKYDNREEMNQAFHKTFGKYIYELTLYEAEDETEEINQLQEQASNTGISLQDLARMEVEENRYEPRECTPFVSKVKQLYQYMSVETREKFGDVNVDTGAVDIALKLSYGNGVILTVNDENKIDEKVSKLSNASFSIGVASYLVESFGREMEQMLYDLRSWVRMHIAQEGETIPVTQLGNRMVVSLENE